MTLGRREFTVAMMATVGGCALPAGDKSPRGARHMFGGR